MSGPDRSIRVLVDDSLRILERRAPHTIHAMIRRLGRLRCRVTVGGERFILVADRTALATTVDTSTALAPEIDVRTDRGALLRVLDGELTLVESIRAGEIVVRGSAADVADLHEALRAYVLGCVLAADTRPLLAEFRAADPARTPERGVLHAGP